MDSKTLADLVKERLGVNTFTRVDPVTATVGVTAAQVLRQNPNRLWVMLVNLSVNDVYVGPFRNPSTTHGILLSPSGGNIILDYREDMELLGEEWWGIASAAGSNIMTIEQLTTRNPGGK